MDHQAYDQKLARILRIAAGEIAQRGFHNTGIRDISRATGVSIAGLYYYFSSKEELLFLIQPTESDRKPVRGRNVSPRTATLALLGIMNRTGL
jgi:hypothetical protein